MDRLRSSEVEHSLGKGKVTGSIPVEGSSFLFDKFRETKFFPVLDSLRGISIVLVLVTHYLDVPWIAGFGNLGLLGVWIFFTISGFLIATNSLRERRREGRLSWRKFFVRRALRILPLYAIVLAAYVIFVPRFEADGSRAAEFFANLPYFATFTFNIVAHPSIATAIFYYSWSLAAEEQFYLVWPAVFNLIRGWWLAGLGCVLVVASYVIEIGIIEYPPFLSLAHRILAYGIVEPIILGVALAHVLDSPKGFPAMAKWPFWPCLVATFGFMAARSAGGPYYGKWTHPIIHLLIVGFVAAAVISELHGRKVLALPPLRRIGQLSYGIYMLNVPMKVLATKVGIGAVGGLALTYVVAELSSRYFEGPMLRLKGRFA